jgi:hypothetical protein
MKRKVLSLVVLLISCPSAFAKAPHPLCDAATGATYASGDGQKTSPYLICNHDQFSSLAAESTVTTKYYRMGIDLDFTDRAYLPIGTFDAPFKGGFDGDGYTLSAIKLPGTARVGVFPALQDAEIKNLTIAGVSLTGFPANNVGGLAGKAENSTIANVHISGIQIDAGDDSGGLVGKLINSTVHHTSTEGTLMNRAGTDGSGGLVGQAFNSDITYSASHVNLVNKTVFPSGGSSSIAGLIGTASKCRIKDVFADGNIDYSELNPLVSVSEVAGLISQADSSYVAYAYYAGKISMNPANERLYNLGGAFAFAANSVIENVFWDTAVSGISDSAAGVGRTTAQMKKKNMWRQFDRHFWLVKPNQYPKLLGIDSLD